MLAPLTPIPVFSAIAAVRLPADETEVKRLRAALAESLAENARFRVQLQETQNALAFLNVENERLEAELKELKQAPFKPRKARKKEVEGQNTSAKPRKRGRPAGHKGSGRSRPKQVDYSEFEIGRAHV